MANMGRKLLPTENPRLPHELFAWLVRAIRAYHPNPDVRNTNQFVEILKARGGVDLKAATINRLETGSLDFSIERCMAYEKALGLPDFDLVDCYIYFCRLAGHEPRTSMAYIRQASQGEMDLLWRLASNERLLPQEWIRLAHLYRNRPDLFGNTKSFKDAFLGRLMSDAGMSYEKNLRLMREALIITGEDICGDILRFSLSDPLRYFNTTEALGFMNGPKSWDALLELSDGLGDGVLAGTIIEPLLRRVNTQSMPSPGDSRLSGFTDYASHVLCDTDEVYTAREEALALILSPQIRVAPHVRRKIGDFAEDIRQLELLPRTLDRSQLVQQIMRSFTRHIQVSPRHVAGTALITPGLDKIVGRGIFAKHRVDRLAMGLLLRPWSESESLTQALGETLVQVDSADYGVQRSMVRMIVKIGDAARFPYLQKFAQSHLRDDNTRLVAAWALGEGIDDNDSHVLRHLYSHANTPGVKRVIITAAERRGFTDVLSAILDDGDRLVAAEAESALQRLRGHEQR